MLTSSWGCKGGFQQGRGGVGAARTAAQKTGARRARPAAFRDGARQEAAPKKGTPRAIGVQERIFPDAKQARMDAEPTLGRGPRAPGRAPRAKDGREGPQGGPEDPRDPPHGAAQGRAESGGGGQPPAAHGGPRAPRMGRGRQGRQSGIGGMEAAKPRAGRARRRRIPGQQEPVWRRKGAVRDRGQHKEAVTGWWVGARAGLDGRESAGQKARERTRP